ncbi:Hypothetical protein D9617_5g069510 [Elsinoe fawcettii]|nr:Hypothetical protein D9617_5g069510 [Elsinoe fawcettii]
MEHDPVMDVPYRGPRAPDAVLDASTRETLHPGRSKLFSLPQEIKDVIWAFLRADTHVLLRLERPDATPSTAPSDIRLKLAGYYDFSDLRTDSVIYDTWHHEDPLLNPSPSSGLYHLLLTCKQAYNELLPLFYTTTSFSLIRFRDLTSLSQYLRPDDVQSITSLQLYLNNAEWDIYAHDFLDRLRGERPEKINGKYLAAWRAIGQMKQLRELQVWLRLPNAWHEAEEWARQKEVVLEPMREVDGLDLRKFEVLLSCPKKLLEGCEVPGCVLKGEEESDLALFRREGWRPGLRNVWTLDAGSDLATQWWEAGRLTGLQSLNVAGLDQRQRLTGGQSIDSQS